MKTLTITGHVDQNGQLRAEVPPEVPPGSMQLVLLVSDEDEKDESSEIWMRGIAREWAEELEDPREDIYSVEDGEPLDGHR